jgi:hypothetical protein
MPTHNKRPETMTMPEIGKLFPAMVTGVPPQKRHKTTGPLDLVNYHDVVKIIESYRPNNVKMVVIHDEMIIEKVLNKIRTDLKILKKGE